MATIPQHDLIAPIIHLNGDRPETLLATLETAYRAVGAAKRALLENAPNERNYYPVDGLFPQAREQHARRVGTLVGLQQELLDELKAIEAQRQT